MEEECSDSGSEDNKPTPTNSDDQVNIYLDHNRKSYIVAPKF